MTLTIQIAMDNAAFEDESEAKRILERLAFETDGQCAVGFHRFLFDFNGNKVGFAEIVE